MGEGGAPLVTQYWGDTRHFFLLNLYIFQNIGGVGGGGTCPLLRASCSFLSNFSNIQPESLHEIVIERNPNREPHCGDVSL